MTTAHDFPDISLSSIGTNGSSPGRHGRLSTFDDDEFVTACSRVETTVDSEAMPNATVDSIVPDSTRNPVYRESLSLFDDSDLDVSRALPPRRTRPAPSPVLEEIDDQEEIGSPLLAGRTLRVTQNEDEEEEEDVIDDKNDVAVEESPVRIYPRLSVLKDSNFRHLDYSHLSKRKGSYRSQMQSPRSQQSPASSAHDDIPEGRQCECGSQAHDKSSDQMYRGLERRFAEALNVSGSQQLRGEEEEECVMAGVLALIESRCCEEATTLVRKRLRQMGATVNRAPSTAVTHIIWSNGGDPGVLRAALDECGSQQRPHVLPPAWVHESYATGIRQPEAAFSLCDERYVRGVERRRSSVANAAPAARAADQTSSTIDVSMSIGVSDGNRTENPRYKRKPIAFSDLTFDQSMSVTQLLQKIDTMAKRLEKVEADPVRHAVRCTSRAAAAAAPAAPAASTQRLGRPPFVQLDLPRPLRRRSHDGYTLEHRREAYDAEERRIRLASRDVLETLPVQQLQQLQQQPPVVRAAAPPVHGVDDMRRTVETDLNRIRQTLRNNARYSQAASVRGGGRGRAGTRGGGFRPHFTFVLPTSPRSPDRRRGRPSIPVVKTQSKKINQLQAVHSSEEFAKAPKTTSRKRLAMLTGFGGREERHLLALADAVQLRITKEMDDSLRAVVSSDGARTVSTLRAVVRGVPVVTEDWIRSCKRANRLVHTLPFEWPQWAELAKVCDFCSPSTPVLKELIMKSGGWLTSSASEAALIVAPQGVYGRRERREDGAMVVEEKYILDCITENKLIPLRGMNQTIDDLSLLSED
ncbi:hypothetical protein PRIPAC_86146 [Pristionchus pacificus]|uniref:Uncharacterized protein n=1 Tax=Pristionchus pacificus TaxID=54126 RepID=A0A2A6BRU5_PRIPA|nr:hypothetical protein PRIPAC_86146 [Pristionchus pacificus]|eukprot:PDM68615.1 hypothetical protein PRIPAC_46917 [Pristionchus pacificus]